VLYWMLHSFWDWQHCSKWTHKDRYCSDLCTSTVTCFVDPYVHAFSNPPPWRCLFALVTL